jgi:uncharacterized protein YjbJ (UPF0337 family)
VTPPRVFTPRSNKLALLAALFVLTAPVFSFAQSSGGPIDIQLFRPAVDSKGPMTLDSPRPLPHLALGLRTTLVYAYQPLALSGPPKTGTWCSDGTSSCSADDPNYISSRYGVDHLVTGYLGGVIGLFKRFEVGFTLPVSFWLGSSEPAPQQGTDTLDIGRNSAVGLGDTMLHIKANILSERRAKIGVGTRLTVAFPTAPSDSFLGSGRFRVTPVLLVERHFWRRRIQLVLNLGAHLRFGKQVDPWVDKRQCQLPQSTTNVDCGTGRTLETTHHLFYGAGLSIRAFRRKLYILAELIGQTGFNGLYDLDPAGPLVSAHEVLLGFRWRLAGHTFFEAGAGFGLNSGESNVQIGSPRFRGYFGLSIDATISFAKEQATKVANYGPIKNVIEAFRKKAEAKLAEYVDKAKKKAKDKIKEVALSAISNALDGLIPASTRELIDDVLASYERWKKIQEAIVEYASAKGAALRRAKARLKTLLRAGKITTSELEQAVRAWVKKRVIITLRLRAERVIKTQIDALLRPVFDQAANALNAMAGSVPAVGGVLTVSVGLLVAKARNKVTTALHSRAMDVFNRLLDRTFDRFCALLFKKGSKLDRALSWLNKRATVLEKALDAAADRLETQRKALLSKLR